MMTKSRRLIYLLDLLQRSEGLCVRDIADMCGVSRRTVYRDIQELSRLRFPVLNDQGYRLDQSAELPLNPMTTAQLCLLSLCLRNSPLMEHPYFQQQLQAIEKQIEACRQSDEIDDERLLLFETTGSGWVPVSKVDILAEFFMAVHHRRKVKIRLVGSEEKPQAFIPLAIRYRDYEQSILLAPDENELLEIPVSQLAWIGLSHETWSERPTHLLAGEAGKKLIDQS